MDPFALDEEALLGLAENLPRMEARRIIRDLRYRSDVRLTPDQVYDLTYASTEDRDQAEEAMKAMIHALLRAGQTPQFS